MIERHCRPTKLDIMPFGTLIKVFCDNGDTEYFIQIGDEASINWQPVSYLLDERCKCLYEDKEFIDELLQQYEDCERPIRLFTNILLTKL